MKNANSHKSFNPDRPALSPGEASALLYAPFDEQRKGKPRAPTSPPVAVAPVIPPAIQGPRLAQCGEPFDGANDYWIARQAVIAFQRSPGMFARGWFEENRRQDLPITGTFTELENAVFGLRRTGS